MKSTLLLQLLIVAFVFFPACKKNKKINMSGVEEITIDPREAAILPIDTFLKKIDYIKLETSDENLIGRISQILFTDSLIIVADRDVAKAVYVFDRQGKFKYQLGRRGNGPGEYVEASHITLVPGKEQIVIQDCPQDRILYYNYAGKYLTVERFPFMLLNFEFLQSGYKAFNVSAMHDPTLGKLRDSTLIVTDGNHNVVYGACYDFYQEDKFTFDKNKSLWRYGDTVYYSPGFSNMIYTVSDSMVYARYYINLWNNIPEIDENVTNEKFEAYTNTHFYFNGHFVELNDLTFINIFTPYGIPFVVYSHSRKQTFYGSGYGEHPFCTFLHNRTPIARYKENCIVVYVNAFNIEAWKEELYKKKAYNDLLDDLYDGLTSDSNPVLFFYHLSADI
jgi:hypothetical protein